MRLQPCLFGDARWPFFRAAVPVLLLVVAVPQLGAQHGPYRRDFDGYSVIYSAVRSDSLPEEMARRHGLPANSNAALLNVTVQRDGMNIEAVIAAAATNLAEQLRDIEMRETVANDLVSYVGVVDIADEEVLDFVLDVMPEGAAESYRVEFRESFLPEPHPDPLRVPREAR